VEGRALTFRELQDYVLGYGFKESQRTIVKTAINYQWGRIWAQHSWTFKDVGPTNLAVVASSSSPVMPTDFAEVVKLQDQNGSSLSPLPADEFDDLYEPLVRDGGKDAPEAFKVINFQIVLGPVPSASQTFTLSYKRRVGYHPAGNTSLFTVGSMAADADVPAYLPVEHHPWIGIRAARMVMRQVADPSWANLEPEIQEAEAEALNELLPQTGGETLQYGRDMWGL
jgi:hypothetical protein